VSAAVILFVTFPLTWLLIVLCAHDLREEIHKERVEREFGGPCFEQLDDQPCVLSNVVHAYHETADGTSWCYDVSGNLVSSPPSTSIEGSPESTESTAENNS
jgi:hypothetical protein